jgi:hypothetical protein
MLGLGIGAEHPDFTKKKEIYTNTHAVAKGLTATASHYIRSVVPANSVLNFKEDDAFTISFWVKVGWNVGLDASVYLFNQAPSDASSIWDNNIAIRYIEPFNRISLEIRNNPGGAGNKDIEAQWLFHSIGGQYAEGNAAAGLGVCGDGSCYWGADNRGNVGDDDFTLITITKTTATASTGVTLYWNATSCNDATDGAPAIHNQDTDAANMAMVSNEEKAITIGSAYDYTAAGANAETQYNDLAIWNKVLTAAEVTAIYNSGTPMDLGVDSGDYASSANLQLYYKFENNGKASEDAALSDGLDLTVAGDSNFEAL